MFQEMDSDLDAIQVSRTRKPLKNGCVRVHISESKKYIIWRIANDNDTIQHSWSDTRKSNTRFASPANFNIDYAGAKYFRLSTFTRSIRLATAWTVCRIPMQSA